MKIIISLVILSICTIIVMNYITKENEVITITILIKEDKYILKLKELRKMRKDLDDEFERLMQQGDRLLGKDKPSQH